MIIAIDGPAAAGKGTLARRLAAHLDFAYLDSGLHRSRVLPPLVVVFSSTWPGSLDDRQRLSEDRIGRQR